MLMCVCERVGVCVHVCTYWHAFISASIILCAIMAHPCDYHFYVLAQKVLPDHAITTGPRGVWVCVCGGGSAARGDECEGMECLCTLCIWTACPFSNNFTRQKLKLRGNTASKVIIIICATEKSEFLFTLEPSSLSWISISKQRRWHWRELLEERTQLDQGCNCRHVAPFHWRGEEVKPRAPKGVMGVERCGRVSAFLIQRLGKEKGMEEDQMKSIELLKCRN